MPLTFFHVLNNRAMRISCPCSVDFSLVIGKVPWGISHVILLITKSLEEFPKQIHSDTDPLASWTAVGSGILILRWSQFGGPSAIYTAACILSQFLGKENYLRKFLPLALCIYFCCCFKSWNRRGSFKILYLISLFIYLFICSFILETLKNNLYYFFKNFKNF